MSKFAGFSFTCQGCQGKFYQLTEKFVPTPPMRGDYVELLPQYGPNGYNWYDFPHNEWTIGDNVACVQCGEPIRMDYVLHKAAQEQQQEQERIEGLRTQAGPAADIQGDSVVQAQGEADGDILPGCAVNSGDDVRGVVHVGGVSVPDDGDVGLYDEVDLEDGLLASVLRMTAEGQTQTVIAETCGISVYRVRKLQNGELK